jgi:hypothetical protein
VVVVEEDKHRDSFGDEIPVGRVGEIALSLSLILNKKMNSQSSI